MSTIVVLQIIHYTVCAILWQSVNIRRNYSEIKKVSVFVIGLGLESELGLRLNARLTYRKKGPISMSPGRLSQRKWPEAIVQRGKMYRLQSIDDTENTSDSHMTSIE